MTIIARTSSSSGPTDIAIVGVSTSLSDRNVSCIAPLRQIVRQLKAKDHAKMPSNIFPRPSLSSASCFNFRISGTEKWWR
ncbi:hypothetical protein PF002_g30045 [Phytophthora fragariae]|uniref:Uncharacterized protein n=1 Tax=Phytophthora fragariae TaxID=53985 RepID=A0A6A3VRN3_9STRA|nr:hypothetical protein PF002_g30045 [Phytophthora fragariae]